MRVFLAALLMALTPALSAQPARVVASIEPLAMVAREVLGEAAPVQTLLRPAQNLHQASLTPGQARTIRDARVFVWLGASAEPQLAPLVARREGTSVALLEQPGITTIGGGHAHHDHDHNKHDEDAETALDPHLWLDPDNIAAIARALAAAMPEARADAFIEALEVARAAVAEQLKPWRAQAWLSHHDPWAYFHRAFSLRKPLVINPALMGGMSSRRMLTLSQTMEREQVQCVIAEPEARRALLDKLCGDGCRLVEADPLGRDQAGAVYTAYLRELGRRFSRCLGG